MNIFVVDKDPVIAAQMLCDRHVNKMILETAQMLSFVADRHNHPSLYSVKGSHANHPCTIWAGNTYENWSWLIEHGLALNDEKIYRTGKSHKSAYLINWYKKYQYGPPKDGLKLEPFALAMPEYIIQKYKKDPVEAYRQYYLLEKQFFKDDKRPTWKKRSPPAWWHYE